MQRHTRFFIIALVLALAAAGFFLGPRLSRTAQAQSGSTTTPSSSTTATQNVQVVLPQRVTVTRPLIVPACVDPYEQADLYAKISGYVSEIHADIGDHVKGGQTLAVLDVPEVTAELAEAQARQVAKQALVKVARQQAQSDQAEQKLREVTFERQKQLFADKAITHQQFDESQSELEVARSRSAMADAQIAAAEADTKLAAAQVQNTKAMLSYARIVAPFDGVVTRRLIDRGALAQPVTATRTMPLFTVQRIDTMRIFIEIPESALANVKPGMAATFAPYDAAIAPIEAKITRISSALDKSTRTMKAQIDVPNPQELLLPGMYARVTLSVALHTNAMTVPATAIATEGNDTFVYTVRDGHAVRTPVKTSLDDGLRVEITGGLADTDAVITAGKGLVSDGAAVTATAVTSPKG